MKERKKNQ